MANPGRYNGMTGLCGRATAELIGRHFGDAHQWDEGLIRAGAQVVPVSDIKPGDICVYNNNYGSNRRQHVGVYAIIDGKPKVVSNGVNGFQREGVVVLRRPGTPYFTGTGKPQKPTSVTRKRPAAKPAPKPAAKPVARKPVPPENVWGSSKRIRTRF